MRKASAVILALFFCFSGCVCHPAYKDTNPRVYYSSLESITVQVEVDCPDASGSGSGVVLGPVKMGGSIIATAAHVAREDCEITIGGAKAKIVHRDEAADWALVYSPLVARRYVTYADVYLGMSVVAVGYAWQRLEQETDLQISVGELIHIGGVYRVSASFYGGSSGGPVFDSKGRLVGLAVSYLRIANPHTTRPEPLDDHYYVTPGKPIIEMYRRLAP